MTPDEITGYCGGFDLTAANYSGGAGGTFTNLLAGADAWTVQGATPTFATVNGMEGMNFGGLATERIIGRGRFVYEGTVVMIARAAGSGNYYAYGGVWTGGNSFGLQINGYRTQAFNPITTSGLTAIDTDVAVNAHVFAVSWSPENGTAYAQQDDGPISSITNAPSGNDGCFFGRHMIGGMRTTYMSGWIGRVLTFARALHYRDNASLQALIATEMAKVGLGPPPALVGSALVGEGTLVG